MNIAMMTNSYTPFTGGVSISVDRLAHGLRRAGHAVTIFAPEYADAREHSPGVVRCRTMGTAGVFAAPSIFDPRPFKEFRRNRFDIIHVHHPMLMGNTAWVLAKMHSLPLVFTWHTLYSQYLHYLGCIRYLEERSQYSNTAAGRKLAAKTKTFLTERFVPWYIRSFARACDHVFVPARGIRKMLHDGSEDFTVDILPTGIPDYFFASDGQSVSDIRKRWARKGGLFCTVSRLAKEKNISFLLCALSFYKRTYKKKFTFLVIGDGPEQGNLRQAVKSLGLSDCVAFIGEVPNSELHNYYAAADLFLFASKSETQGIVVLEAMAGGTPVVALDASGVNEVVSHGENGLLAEEAPEKFAQAVNEMACNRDFYNKAKKGALDTARSFSLTNIAAQAEAAYEQAVLTKQVKKHHAVKIMRLVSQASGSYKPH